MTTDTTDCECYRYEHRCAVKNCRMDWADHAETYQEITHGDGPEAAARFVERHMWVCSKCGEENEA